MTRRDQSSQRCSCWPLETSIEFLIIRPSWESIGYPLADQEVPYSAWQTTNMMRRSVSLGSVNLEASVLNQIIQKGRSGQYMFWGLAIFARNIKKALLHPLRWFLSQRPPQDSQWWWTVSASYRRGSEEIHRGYASFFQVILDCEVYRESRRWSCGIFWARQTRIDIGSDESNPPDAALGGYAYYTPSHYSTIRHLRL